MGGGGRGGRGRGYKWLGEGERVQMVGHSAFEAALVY